MMLLSAATGSLMKNYDHMANCLKATLIGIVGVVLLVIFCAGLIRIGTINKLLPFIIGFNAALTGYNLVRRADGRLKYRRIWSVAAGIMMAIGAVLILNIVSRYYTGGDIVYIAGLLILVPIGGVFSFLGAILAIRYFKL